MMNDFAYTSKKVPYGAVITPFLAKEAKLAYYDILTKKSAMTRKAYESAYTAIMQSVLPFSSHQIYSLLEQCIRFITEDSPDIYILIDTFVLISIDELIPKSNDPIYPTFLADLKHAVKQFLTIFASSHGITTDDSLRIIETRINPDGHSLPIHEKLKRLDKTNPKLTPVSEKKAIHYKTPVTGDEVFNLGYYKEYITYCLHASNHYDWTTAQQAADILIADCEETLQLIQSLFIKLSDVVAQHALNFPDSTQQPVGTADSKDSKLTFVAFTEKNRRDPLAKFQEFRSANLRSVSNKNIDQSFEIINHNSEIINGKIGADSKIAKMNVFIFMLYSIGYLSTISFAMRFNKESDTVSKLYNSVELPISKLFNKIGLQHMIDKCNAYLSTGINKFTVKPRNELFIDIMNLRYACVTSLTPTGSIQDIEADGQYVIQTQLRDIITSNKFFINIDTTRLQHPEMEQLVQHLDTNPTNPLPFKDLIVFRMPDLGLYQSIYMHQHSIYQKCIEQLEILVQAKLPYLRHTTADLVQETIFSFSIEPNTNTIAECGTQTELFEDDLSQVTVSLGELSIEQPTAPISIHTPPKYRCLDCGISWTKSNSANRCKITEHQHEILDKGVYITYNHA